MRIALVQDHLRVGGTERQTVTLANRFAASGNEVLLLTFRPAGPLEAAISSAVQRGSLQPFDCRADWFAPGLAARLRRFSPEVVQLMGRMANCRGSRIIRALPGVPVVATCRTGKSIPWPYQSTLRRAATIVFNSRDVAGAVCDRHAIAPSKAVIIRNALSTTTSSNRPREVTRREVGTPEDAVVFIRTAMFRREKAQAELLHLFGQLTLPVQWELWLVGDGPERRRCESLARESPIKDRVRFLGLRGDHANLNEAADIAVLLSHRESLPNCLAEAQWAGLPVVARELGGVAESFVPGKSGLLIPAAGPDDEFREALRTLALDAGLRRRMGDAARDFARCEFDPVARAQEHIDLYRRLVDAQ